MTEYKITLDKERTLRYSNRACLELEKRIGKSVISIFTDAYQEKTPELQQQVIMTRFSSSKFITDFIYCGLLHESPSLTYEQVMDIIPMNQYMEIIQLAPTILAESFGFAGKSVKQKKK